MQEPNFSYTFYGTTSEAWEAMLLAIPKAEKSIYWEVYAFIDTGIGERFIDALIAQAAKGVVVKLVIDAVGSYALSRAAIDKFKKSGVDVRFYNPLFPQLRVFKWLNSLMNRNHRKILIIDEQIAFLGGVNVDSRSATWDDLYLRLTGPMIRPLLLGFAKSYISVGGPKIAVKKLLHSKLEGWREWRKSFKFLIHSPGFHKVSPLQKIYIRGLMLAKESVDLVTPYYLPDAQFLKALADAQKRGVKVNIFLPLRPDHKFMELLASTYYKFTVGTGAKLFFSDNMNHAKAMTVDKQYGVVGSMNVTRRSAAHDEEVSLTFNDKNMVEDLNTLIRTWKDRAVEYAPDVHSARMNWFDRVQLWLALKIEKYL